jgi:hypothetical protein
MIREHRLLRLEKATKQAAASGGLATPDWPDDDRVQAVRKILARLREPDPCPALQGRAYLERFWDWWFGRERCEATGHYPRWATHALSRISGMPDERRAEELRGMLRSFGLADPFPR